MYAKYGPLDDGGVPEVCQFLQGAPRGGPVHAYDEGPCVLVLRGTLGAAALGAWPNVLL